MALVNENLARTHVIFCPSTSTFKTWGYDAAREWYPLNVVKAWSHGYEKKLYPHNDLVVLVDAPRGDITAFEAAAIANGRPLIEQYQALQLPKQLAQFDWGI